MAYNSKGRPATAWGMAPRCRPQCLAAWSVAGDEDERDGSSEGRRKGHRQGSAADTPASVCVVSIVSSQWVNRYSPYVPSPLSYKPRPCWLYRFDKKIPHLSIELRPRLGY